MTSNVQPAASNVPLPDRPKSAPPEAHSYTPTLSNHEFSETVSALGIRKTNSKPWQLLLLGILAGMYIGFGGHVFLVAIEQGMGRIVGGLVFSLGLVLVLIAGAELFTGNIILIVSAITGLISPRRMMQNWVFVYVGNFIGSYALALMVWAGGLLGTPDAPTSVGRLAGNVAEHKIELAFGEALVLGILCNILVVLAIIMATMARDIVSKAVCIALPIMAFVAAGFEHCVANMYLIPVGLLATGVPAGLSSGLWHNLIPVTLGNILGGVLILLLHPNRLRQLGHLLDFRGKGIRPFGSPR